VSVYAGDVKDFAILREADADVVTARSFAAPEITARWSGVLLRSGGMLIVSEPPDDDPARWPDVALASAGLVDMGRHQGVRLLRKR
jgi:hypothetical protein